MATIGTRLSRAWNAFRDSEEHRRTYGISSGGSGYRPNQMFRRIQNERSVITMIYNWISVDCSLINVNHVRLDENGNFKEIIDDSLNDVLHSNANIDQTGRLLLKEAVYSMLDDGTSALVPIDTDGNPFETDSFKVLTARVGRVVQWLPREVVVEVYDDETGRRRNIILEKRFTPIFENPFYTIMNEPNSTLQRLIHVMKQLDQTNDRTGSDRMDLIVQLPYPLKSESQREQANRRQKEIEAQLTASKYGIAYIDATEHVIQLNRGVENNLLTQWQELKDDLYNQTGLCKAIFDGTADEATILNYNNRTISPIMSTITEEIERKWLSRTAKSQKQAIRYFNDPFKIVPISQIAEIADKFTRNCIMTSNEMRSVIGMKPSDDPKANELINSNLNQPEPDKTETIKEEKININE